MRAGIVALGLSFLAGTALAQEAYVPAEPEAGTDIPQAAVRVGLLPYADGSFVVIGVEKGYFNDVGIDVATTNATDDSARSLLMRGDLDVVHNYPPNFLPTYKTTQVIKQVMFHDVIVAGCILAHPSLGLKSIKDYFEEGMSFDKAIAAAMAPIQDQSLASTPIANERLFEETISQLSGVTWQPQILDDPNILVAAKAGKIQFAHPSGAPIVYSLIQEGWTRVVCLDDLIAHGPSGADSPITRTITAVGALANGEWVNKNPNTALRYLSAVWRTIDAVRADPSLYDVQAPVLNSIAGTDLTGESLAETVALFHPYIPFEENTRFYADEDSVTNYQRLYQQIMAAFAESGVIPEGLKPDDFVWGGKLWQQMVDYKTRTDEVLKTIDEASLADDRKQALDKARQYYGWHDYLDAYRLALAAAGK